MQGQESRKTDILGLESSLSTEAADLLLTEDTNMVRHGNDGVCQVIASADISYRDSPSRSWQ
jgi:hypothetical protein